MAIEERLKSFEQSRQNMISKKFGNYNYQEYPKWIKDKNDEQVLVEDKVAERLALGLPVSQFPDDDEDNVIEFVDNSPNLPKGYKYHEYPKWIQDTAGKQVLVEDREQELELTNTNLLAAKTTPVEMAKQKDLLSGLKLDPVNRTNETKQKEDALLAQYEAPEEKLQPAQTVGNKTIQLLKSKLPPKKF